MRRYNNFPINVYLFLLIQIFSITIFIHFLKQNMNVNYYDENEYIAFSKQILEHGIFDFQEPLRTYFYPLIISLFNMFSGENLVYSKIITSVFQYSVLIITIIFLANLSYKKFPYKSVPTIIILFGLLNPYLIQASTLFLTDILATCFIVFSLGLMSFNNNRNVTYMSSVFFLFASIMIRPSSSIFIPVYIFILIVKHIKIEKIKMGNFLIISFLLAFIFIPQLYNNVKNYNDWTPLIHKNLYETQSSWAADYLKYGTVVIDGVDPKLFYINPIESDKETIYDLLFLEPINFLFVYFIHIIGILDWGFVDTYINSFDITSRLVASILLYIYWFLVILGLKNYFSSKLNNFSMNALLFSTIIYVLFIGTTLVESRFGYPVFMLLLPFTGLGAHWITTRISFKITMIKTLIWMIIFIISFFIFSIWLDFQTKQVDWEKIIENQYDNEVETVNFSDEINWSFVMNYKDFKIVRLIPNSPIPINITNMMVIDSNGIELNHDDSFEEPHSFSYRFWENPSGVLISVPNTVTGWGESESPTPDQIMTFFKKNKYQMTFTLIK
ncbi:hypothetical protein WAX74_04115 [Psychrobacillus sp. FJAT-51614]|uniref:Glycosyltransferase RgtA/B/C/D-like domain-containing protein n=1 Tax=Psychrobacillus mangrovi TaxID=3117745 RepID=A0ABU8F1H9_9BACI